MYAKNILYKFFFYIISLAIFSVILGLIFTKKQGFKYKATTTFIINENFGIQDISPGGAYYGENLYELIKSYNIIESVLLTPINANSTTINLANYLIKIKFIQFSDTLINDHFFDSAKSGSLTQEQVFIMKELHRKLVSFENFKIGVSERGQILPSIDIYNKDEYFAKKFSDLLFIEINKRYNSEKLEKKNKNLINLLSINDTIENNLKSTLDQEIATEIFMLNESMSIILAPNSLRKNDLQNNIASLVRNKSNIIQSVINKNKQINLLEIVDTPNYPLLKIEPSYFKFIISFFVFSSISMIFFFSIFMKK